MLEAMACKDEAAVRSAASRANMDRYGDSEVVARYQADGYHSLRLDLVVRLCLRHYPPDPRGRTSLLELGSGTPVLAQKLMECGYSVVASDASKKVVDDILSMGIPAKVVDVNDIRADVGKYDIVVAGELIEHIFNSTEFIRQVVKCLKPDGALVLTTPNLAGLQDRIRFLGGRSPRQVDPTHPYLWLHIRPFTPSMLDKVLRREGFVRTQMVSNFVAIRFGDRRMYLRWLAVCLPGLGGSLVAMYKRRGASRG